MNPLDAVQNASLVEEFKKEKKFPVVEIFGPTIQGEGPLAGSKTMFVRFGGCDFRCGKCDSLHAVLPSAVKKHAKRLTAPEIVASLEPEAQRTGTHWVTLSGGNPCMWDLDELHDLLHQAGMLVSVETQGSLAPAWLKKTDVVVVSPKSPGMEEKFNETQFMNFLATVAERTVALKVVIFSQQDIDFALSVGHMATYGIGVIPKGMRFLSLGNPYPPRLDDDLELRDRVPHNELTTQLLREYRILIEDMTNDRRVDDWKFLPQLHVLAFGNETGR